MQHLELAEEALMCPECFCLASPEEIDGVLRCAICLTPTPIRQENEKEEERKKGTDDASTFFKLIFAI